MLLNIQEIWPCVHSPVPKFIAKMPNAFVTDLGFRKFTILSWSDFINREKEEMLLCLNKIVRGYPMGQNNITLTAVTCLFLQVMLKREWVEHQYFLD